MHVALEAIWLMLGAANRYFSAQQPWVLRKSDAEADQVRFATVLYTTCEAVRIAALLIQPVMPESASKLLDLLGQSQDQRTFAAIGARLDARHDAAAAHRSVPALPGRLSSRAGQANMNGHAPLVVSVSHGMSGALDSVQRQRQLRTVADEVAPPRLGVRQVCRDLDLVTVAAVCHRNTEPPSRTSPGVGDHRDTAPKSRPEAGRVRYRRYRSVEYRRRAHD